MLTVTIDIDTDTDGDRDTCPLRLQESLSVSETHIDRRNEQQISWAK